MKKVSFLLIPIFFCCLTCDTKTPQPKPDPEPQLPPATTTGANTFGMLVNGEVWLPEIKPWRFVESKFGFEYHKGKFVLLGNKVIDSDSIREQVILNFTTPTSLRITDTGKYLLRNWRVMGGGLFLSKQCEYETDSINNGILTITRLDTTNWIISGTFEMPVMISKDSDCKETVSITEGRFDIKY